MTETADPDLADAGATTDAGSTVTPRDPDETLTVGIRFDAPGLSLLEQDDQYSGAEIDLAREIAKGLGFAPHQVNFTEAPRSMQVPLLTTGQVDLVIATSVIPETPSTEIQFAGPYLIGGMDLLVRGDSSIHGPEDLPGSTVCSVGVDIIPAEHQAEGTEVATRDSFAECVRALANGEVDATSAADVYLAGLAQAESPAGQLRLTRSPVTLEPLGVGLPLDSDLCEPINEILSQLWQDGSMERIITRHLGASGFDPHRGANPPEIGGHCA